VTPLILVVEDERLVHRVALPDPEGGRLDRMCAENAIDALEWLSRIRVPDPLLLDMHLPGMSGPDLALRIHDRYPHIPVLFMSGWAGQPSNPGRLAPLRWAFLPKPFSGDDLLEATQRLLPSG
jgi:two-component system, cell cycle sensor histidine kinase and response regulator CckA